MEHCMLYRLSELYIFHARVNSYILYSVLLNIVLLLFIYTLILLCIGNHVSCKKPYKNLIQVHISVACDSHTSQSVQGILAIHYDVCFTCNLHAEYHWLVLVYNIII